MSDAQKVLGSCIRSFRESQRFTLESLAEKAGISYQYLSGVENGRENFTIQVLDAIARSLGIPVPDLFHLAFSHSITTIPPMLDSVFFREHVPLPPKMTLEHIKMAANNTQLGINRISYNIQREVGISLQAIFTGNNFSVLVSNILTNSLDKFSSYKYNNSQQYHCLFNTDMVSLNVKATINFDEGGESNNGHKGWHLLACYKFVNDYNIEFIHIMLANLNGHKNIDPDWKFRGKNVDENIGSRQAEKYITNCKGTTKLHEGSIYLVLNQ
jgi:transcriptional regulator with XRE-family HTH domain